MRGSLGVSVRAAAVGDEPARWTLRARPQRVPHGARCWYHERHHRSFRRVGRRVSVHSARSWTRGLHELRWLVPRRRARLTNCAHLLGQLRLRKAVCVRLRRSGRLRGVSRLGSRKRLCVCGLVVWFYRQACRSSCPADESKLCDCRRFVLATLRRARLEHAYQPTAGGPMKPAPQ